MYRTSEICVTIGWKFPSLLLDEGDCKLRSHCVISAALRGKRLSFILKVVWGQN